jgi:exosome complex exonuclease DIS3/RRP44
VLATRFTKSAIRSRAALTYAEAQSRIDDERLTDEISVRPSCPPNPLGEDTG